MAVSNSFYKNLFNGINSRIKKTLSNPYKKVNVNWLSLKYLKHLTSENVHSHQLMGHLTFFYNGPEYLHGLREIFIENIYDQHLPENAFILDCGAHIGLSVIYLKSICPSAHIICFEPDTKNLELLRKNILSHQLQDIEIRNEAVWNENTSLHFIQEGNMGSKIGENLSSNTITVKASRLKDFLSKKVDFLKLDIEGAEYKVLKDIAENLGNIDKMFIEYHGTFDQNKELLEILELVSNAGFKFYIKEAASVFDQPFLPKKHEGEYDLQLNMFCFREKS
jgi:FkbM family methyltransferase